MLVKLSIHDQTEIYYLIGDRTTNMKTGKLKCIFKITEEDLHKQQ